MTKEFKLQLLLGLFVAFLLMSNFLGIKIVPMFGTNVSVGTIFVPAMFLITDIVSEVMGRKYARGFVIVGMVSLAMVLLGTWLCLILPASDRFGLAAEYSAIFGLSLRFTIASIIAFALSQINDVNVFHWFKEKTKGRMLWLRNNASTAVSQAVDTLVFMFIAFYGVEGFSVPFILELALSYYLIKILFAALDTPLVYAGVKWLNKA